MIPLPRPDKEVALSDWSSSGEAWTHLPYLARFPARRLPASWEGLLTGRHCAVLESGRTGRYTIVVPDAHQAWRFDASGGATLHQDGGAQALPRNRALEALASWVRAHRAPRLAGWPAFQGGLVVALGYELATELEPVRAAADDLGLPRAVLLDAREALVHDAATGELTAVVLSMRRTPTVPGISPPPRRPDAWPESGTMPVRSRRARSRRWRSPWPRSVSRSMHQPSHAPSHARRR